jgi:hypothetical protein
MRNEIVILSRAEEYGKERNLKGGKQQKKVVHCGMPSRIVASHTAPQVGGAEVGWLHLLAGQWLLQP